VIPNTTAYMAAYVDSEGFHSHRAEVVAWCTKTGDALVVDTRKGGLVPAKHLSGFKSLVLV
jgi:hypothetical protein